MLNPDLPLKNLDENDRLGVKKKADAIVRFIENRWDYLQKNNMIALYGNWGSGKSSVINHIISKLDENKFICLKFDAWLYEKDDNLPYSLLEFILDKLEEKFKDDETIKSKIKENAEKTLKLGWYVLGGLAKGIKFSVKTPFLAKLLGVPEVNFEYDMEKVVNHFDEKEDEEFENMSYHQKVKELKDCFRELSNILIEDNKKLIIFIDELDRCEAENILSLLASIKLFFSLGDDNEGNKNIVYFVAVDKEAVSKAIEVKYKDIIKAEEYLEKIFNISFSMPKYYELKEFIKQYKFFDDDKIAEKLEKFFKAINFTNPRHLKKVLNKYAILTEFKSSNIDDGLIPDIIRIENGERKGYLLDTVFVLYFIILYEFHPENYKEVKSYKHRVERTKLISILYNSYAIGKKNNSYLFKGYLTNDNDREKFKKFKREFIECGIRFRNFMELLDHIDETERSESPKYVPLSEFNSLIYYISMVYSKLGELYVNNNPKITPKMYEYTGITVNFWEYIKNNYKDLKTNDYLNRKDYSFTNLFKMVETYL